MKTQIDLRAELYKLDWIKIMQQAIESRPSSWNRSKPFECPILEWRNASDEVCYAVINALEDKGLITPIRELIKKDIKKIKRQKL